MARATTNHYDLIVLGTDFAGLVAAALVARRGKRVLVIPHGPIDGRYRLARRGFSLDTAPLVHLGALESVVDQLQRLEEEMFLDYLMCAPLSHESFVLFTERVLPKLL